MFFLIPFLGIGALSSTVKWGSRAILAVQAFNFFSGASSLAAVHLFESDVDIDAANIIFPEYLTPRHFRQITGNIPFKVGLKKENEQKVCSGKVTIGGKEHTIKEEGEYFYCENTQKIIFAKKGLPLMEVSIESVADKGKLNELLKENNQKLSQANEKAIREIFRDQLVQPRSISNDVTNPKVETKTITNQGVKVKVGVKVTEHGVKRDISANGEYFLDESSKLIFLQYGHPSVEIDLSEHKDLLGKLRANRGGKLPLEDEKALRVIIEVKLKQQNEKLLDEFISGLPRKYKDAMNKLKENQEKLQEAREGNRGIFNIFADAFSKTFNDLFSNDDILDKVLKYRLNVQRLAEKMEEIKKEKSKFESEVDGSRDNCGMNRKEEGLNSVQDEDPVWLKQGKLKELKEHKDLLEKRKAKLEKFIDETNAKSASARDLFAKKTKKREQSLQGTDEQVAGKIHAQLKDEYTEVNFIKKMWMRFRGKLTAYEIVRRAIVGPEMKESITAAVKTEFSTKEIVAEITELQKEISETNDKIETVRAVKEKILEKEEAINARAVVSSEKAEALIVSIQKQNKEEAKVKKDIQQKNEEIRTRSGELGRDIIEADKKLHELTAGESNSSISNSMEQAAAEGASTEAYELLDGVRRARNQLDSFFREENANADYESLVKECKKQAGDAYKEADSITPIEVALAQHAVSTAASEFGEAVETAVSKVTQFAISSSVEGKDFSAEPVNNEEGSNEKSAKVNVIAQVAKNALEFANNLVKESSLENAKGGTERLQKLQNELSNLDAVDGAIEAIEAAQITRKEKFREEKSSEEALALKANDNIHRLETISEKKWAKAAYLLMESVLEKMEAQGKILTQAKDTGENNAFLDKDALNKALKNRSEFIQALRACTNNTEFNKSLANDLEKAESSEAAWENVYKKHYQERLNLVKIGSDVDVKINILKEKKNEIFNKFKQLQALVMGESYAGNISSIKHLVSELENLRREVEVLTKEIEFIRREALESQENAANLIMQANKMAEEIDERNDKAVEISEREKISEQELNDKKSKLVQFENERKEINVIGGKLREHRAHLVEKQDRLPQGLGVESRGVWEEYKKLRRERLDLLYTEQMLEEEFEKVNKEIQAFQETLGESPSKEEIAKYKALLGRKNSLAVEVPIENQKQIEFAKLYNKNREAFASVYDELREFKEEDDLIDNFVVLMEQYIRCVDKLNSKLDLLKENFEKFSSDKELSVYLTREINEIEFILEEIKSADDKLKKAGIDMEMTSLDKIISLVKDKVDVVQEELSAKKVNDGVYNTQQQGLNAIQRNQLAIDKALVSMLNDPEKLTELQRNMDQAFSAGNKDKMNALYKEVEALSQGNANKFKFIQAALIIRKAYDILLIKHNIAESKNKLVAILQRKKDLEELKASDLNQENINKYSLEIAELDKKIGNENLFIEEQLKKSKDLIEMVLGELGPQVKEVRKQKMGFEQENIPALLVEVEEYSLWNPDLMVLLEEMLYFSSFEQAILGKESSEEHSTKFKEVFGDFQYLSSPVPVHVPLESSLAVQDDTFSHSPIDESALVASIETAMSLDMDRKVPDLSDTTRNSKPLAHRKLSDKRDLAQNDKRTEASNNPFNDMVIEAKVSGDNSAQNDKRTEASNNPFNDMVVEAKVSGDNPVVAAPASVSAPVQKKPGLFRFFSTPKEQGTATPNSQSSNGFKRTVVGAKVAISTFIANASAWISTLLESGGVGFL